MDGGGSGERSSVGGWRCWFAKKEKKRDGGGGLAVWLFV